MDAAILVTMVLSLAIKTDLNTAGESMTKIKDHGTWIDQNSHENSGVLMVLSNMFIPCGGLVYYLPLLWAEEEADTDIDQIYGHPAAAAAALPARAAPLPAVCVACSAF